MFYERQSKFVIIKPMNNPAKNKGFTIVELLVVITILLILGSIILPSLGDTRASAALTKAEAQVDQLLNALTNLSGDTLQYSGHFAAFTADTGAGGNEVWDLNAQAAGLTDTDGLFSNWQGPYISTVPLDPWGNPYFFDPDYDIAAIIGTTSPFYGVVVGSFGPNGAGQNVFDSDNIVEILYFPGQE